VHEDSRRDSKKGRRVESPQTLLDNPVQWDADYLNTKIKVMETTNMEKLKMRRWMSTPNF
jgi:hypothetical protein